MASAASASERRLVVEEAQVQVGVAQVELNPIFVSVVQAARLQCRQRKPQASRLHYDFLGS